MYLSKNINKAFVLSVLLSLIVTSIFYTQMVSILILPYIIYLTFILAKHIVLSKKLEIDLLIEYMFFFSLILFIQTLLFHYYWNYMDNKLTNSLFGKNTVFQSAEVYYKMVYNMDEITSHLYMFFSGIMLFLTFIFYVSENRDNLKGKTEIINILESSIIKAMSIMLGVIGFFLAVESNVLLESIIVFSAFYIYLYVSSKRSYEIKVIRSTYELFFYSFMSLVIISMLMAGISTVNF